MATSIQNASDAELIDIATQTHDAMQANLAGYPGVTQQQVDDLKTFKATFAASLATHVASQAAAKANRQIKDVDRDHVEEQLRTLRNVANAAGATAGAMAATGIPVPSGKAPANATKPAGAVNTSERLRHTISWTDAATLDKKRRPRGAMGAEIWLKLDGPPPTDEKECHFLTLDSATPYLAQYDGSDGGKMAHYLLRWRMRDGSVGAWGETVSATITA